MKRLLKILFLTSIVLSFGVLTNCEKKGEDQEPQPSEEVKPPDIPSPDDMDFEQKEPSIPEPPEHTQKPSTGVQKQQYPAVSKGDVVQPAQTTEPVENKAVLAPRVSVTFRFNAQGAAIKKPIKIKYQNRVLGETLTGQLKLQLKRDYLDKSLQLEAPYFKPLAPVIVSENTKEFNFDLEPLLVKIQVTDSMGIHSSQVGDVRIYDKDKLIGKTDAQGTAEIRASHVGPNNFIFYKPHFFSKQAHIVNISVDNPEVKVSLIPLKHFIRLKLTDERNRVLANREVELAGSGLAINCSTNRRGIATLKSFALKPGVKYQLHIRSQEYTDNEFTFSEKYYDASGKYIAVKIPVRYSWAIRTSTEGADIALYDFKGHKVAEGKNQLNVKIPRGTYKIVAKSGATTKEELINAAATPRTKIIIMDECYAYAQEWNKQHPGNDNLPDEIINCLQGIHTSDPNFINSRMLLAKAAISNKEYGNAKIFYEDILRNDRSKKYNPVILYNTAQASILFSDKVKNEQSKLQLLEQASSDYLDNALAYITKLPIRSRKKWIIKIEYLRGELYQRLFFYYKKIDSYELARQNGNAAIDAFNSFIRDYKSIAPSSSLKQTLKKDYERAVDLISSIQAAQTM